MTKQSFKESFPFLYQYANCGDMMHYYTSKDAPSKHGYKTERGYLKHLARLNDEKREEYTRPDIKRAEISISWHRSRTWGYCPSAEMIAHMADGSVITAQASASGWGYDKQSTVVAELLNRAASGMLYRKRAQIAKGRAPYGVSRWLSLEGGIGLSCYPSIAQFLGGKMTHKEGKTWDYIEFNF